MKVVRDIGSITSAMSANFLSNFLKHFILFKHTITKTGAATVARQRVFC